MRDTIHCLTEGEPDQEAHHGLDPGDGRRRCSGTCPATRSRTARSSTASACRIYLEVQGLGDYLPKYAGNLDIMTAAALRTGEMLAEEMQPAARLRPRE